MAKNTVRSHHRVLIAAQVTLAVLLLTLTVLNGGLIFATPFGGDGGGGDSQAAPSVDGSIGNSNRGEGGSDRGLAIFRAPKVEKRNQWTWDQDEGWKFGTQEETYQNGWAWSWKDGEWTWSRSNTDAPHGLKAAAPTEDTSSSSSSVADRKSDEPGCFDAEGAWITDRKRCAPDQGAIREHALKEGDSSVIDTLPSEIRQAIEIAVPLTPAEETKVKEVLVERFEGPVAVAATQAVVHEATSAVIRKLSILKSSDALTDKEREYFVAKIVEAQALAKEDGADSMSDIDMSADRLNDLIADVQTYVAEHSISVSAPDAPTPSSIFSSAERMLEALPAAFATLEAAGYSTENLVSMHEETATLAAAASVRCSTQRKDCNRVVDVVAQLEKIISMMNDMVGASGDGALKSRVQSNFEQALRR